MVHVGADRPFLHFGSRGSRTRCRCIRQPQGNGIRPEELTLYGEQRGYGCAVYIELGQQPRWQWIGDSEEMAHVEDF
jgi:hypothetical protein